MLELIDIEALDLALSSSDNPIKVYKDALKQGGAELETRFQAIEGGTAVFEVVKGRAALIDAMLVRAWQRFFSDSSAKIALAAVGGYGRGELHPASDIDLLLLIEPGSDDALRDPIESFLMFLWDIGLEVGQSVRTVQECVDESLSDITVITNLMESRLLTGSKSLYRDMIDQTGPEKIWAGPEFFEGKREEQRKRHLKFNDTAYNLEPHLKEGPGGLRDIQTVFWVAKRHFYVNVVDDLVKYQFLTPDELDALLNGQAFLWQIRCALHIITGRREDRLLFDHQTNIAQMFGYKDSGKRLAIEQFMQRYYQTVMQLERLNELLLQLFEEKIVSGDQTIAAVPINARFQSVGDFIEIKYPEVFERYPYALLEIFLLLEQNTKLKGVRADTLRSIRHHTDLINDDFRNDIRARSLFMEILRQPTGITHELRRMNRYGVLAAYIPAFGKIVGQMQHDLFHVYTVDEHTLFVVRNLRRLSVAEFADEFPTASSIMSRIPKPELLYLAGLFHDIAKGRGGDHSTLGAVDAEEFSTAHDLSRYDSDIVSWLVKSHLTMSTTAQRKDISDPQVVYEFAKYVSDQAHLDYLYLLTICDIRATSPTLWNSWKNSLLLDLYSSTTRALRRGFERPFNQDELIEGTQSTAHTSLLTKGFSKDQIDKLWATLPNDYFLNHSAEDVTWHTETILKFTRKKVPVLSVRQNLHGDGVDIFVLGDGQDHWFALTTAIFEKLGLNILQARISRTTDGITLGTYLVDAEDVEVVKNQSSNFKATLLGEFSAAKDDMPEPSQRHLSRQVRHFSKPTEVRFHYDKNNERTILEVFSTEQPALLARISQVLWKQNVRVQKASIATIGSRAEDVFFVTDMQNNPILDQSHQQIIQKELCASLDISDTT